MQRIRNSRIEVTGKFGGGYNVYISIMENRYVHDMYEIGGLKSQNSFQPFLFINPQYRCHKSTINSN